ncbi:MAG: transposase, partial [Gammaproteobacteria bacterium]
LQPWLNQRRKRLTLLFLPPYSPDLNPIERVWKLARRLGHPQSVLPNPRRHHECRVRALQTLGKAK